MPMMTILTNAAPARQRNGTGTGITHITTGFLATWNRAATAGLPVIARFGWWVFDCLEIVHMTNKEFFNGFRWQVIGSQRSWGDLALPGRRKEDARRTCRHL